jgi:hypothetical protein
MKRIGIFLIVLLATLHFVYAQDEYSDIELVNNQRLNLQSRGMIVLGSWAALNFAYSGYQLTQTNGKQYYFNQMNVFWNLVNAGIATTGFISASTSPSDISILETLNETQKFSSVLLLNAGLDLAYITAGFYLKERAKNIQKQKDRFTGYGNSLILQGSFLFVFDLALYFLNNEIANKILQKGDNFQLAISPVSFKAIINL